MEDDCRGTEPLRHREAEEGLGEAEEGLGEAALGPAALSMEATPRHVNLTWIPAATAQPFGLFQRRMLAAAGWPALLPVACHVHCIPEEENGQHAKL